MQRGEKMKYAYAIALFLIVLMVGCAQPQAPPAAPPPAAPAAPEAPPAAPAAPEAPPAEPAAPEAPPAAPADTPTAPAETAPPATTLPEGDIKITAAGLEPAELTINVGDTVTWVNAQETRNAALGTPILSGPIAPKTAYSKKFDAAGTISYLDLISKKSGKIIVKAAAATGGATTTTG